MSDLKHCPFCGGAASHNGGGGSVFGRFWWTVGCKTCDIWISDQEVWSQTAHGILDPAYPAKHCFTLWNNRAIQVEQTKSAMSECDFDGLFLDGIAEAVKAMEKYPQPNYVISKIAEEAGEVVKAAIHCAEGRETPENLRSEMKQLIAMLYRLWIEGDQVHGLAPVSLSLASQTEGQ